MIETQALAIVEINQANTIIAGHINIKVMRRLLAHPDWTLLEVGRTLTAAELAALREFAYVKVI